MNTPKSKIAVIIGQYAARTGMNKDEYHSLLEALNTRPKQKLSKKDKKIVRALQHALNCADAQNAITKSGIEVSEVATFLQDLVSSYEPAEKQDYSGLNDLERVIHRSFLAAGVENVPVGIIKETAQECLAQMKPAEWDDYTKTNLDRAIQIIKNAKGNLQGYQTDDGIYECDKAIEALEHFLYRGLEIDKPAEWSEEDEMYLSQAIEDLEHENYLILADKLKFLRPKPKRINVSDQTLQLLICYLYGCHDVTKRDGEKADCRRYISYLEDLDYTLKNRWKPSEEQMDALEETISQDCAVCNGDRKWIKPNLESLYEQLKAL